MAELSEVEAALLAELGGPLPSGPAEARSPEPGPGASAAGLSEVEAALLAELGGPVEPTAPAAAARAPRKKRSRSKKAQTAKKSVEKRPQPLAQRESSSSEVVLPTEWEALNPSATPAEHILEGTREALVFAREVVRGTVVADAKTRVSAARLLTDLGVAQVQLQMQAERERENSRILTEDEQREKRRRVLRALIRRQGA